MAIDVGALVEDMLTASRGTLSKKQWAEVRDYAESEFKKIGEAITLVQKTVNAALGFKLIA